MTKKQRAAHIEGLVAIVKSNGGRKDRWGMWHIGPYKFDTRKVNLKVYEKTSGGFVKIFSKVMTKISYEEMAKMVVIWTGRVAKRTVEQIKDDIARVECAMSPENVSMDGECSPTETSRRMRALNAEFKKLMKELKTVEEVG